MRKRLLFILLFFPLFAFTQTINLGVSKDLKWAEWMYETIEFKDDCTILKGFFIPSKNGCWVRSNMDETLEANGKKYRIIFTTLPINRHPRKIFKGGSKVYFEEHFEPIFSTGGSVKLTTHDISFAIPLKKRELTTPYENLLPEYEKHLDSLIVKGKYNLAAYLLNQYVTEVWKYCGATAKKKIKDRIKSKYCVQDLFLNASPDEGDILSYFEDTYHRLGIEKNDNMFRQLHEIDRLQIAIRLNMNGKNMSNVLQWCESLLLAIRKYGRYNKCYENALSLYRKALVMDGQTPKIPKLDNEIIDVCSNIYIANDGLYLERLTNIASDLDFRFSKTSYEMSCGINIWKEVRDKAKQIYPNSLRYACALKEIADYNYRYKYFDVALNQYLSIDSLYPQKRNEWILEAWSNHDALTYEQSITYVDLIYKSVSRSIGYCYYKKGDIMNSVKYDYKNPYYHYELHDLETLSSLCKEAYAESMRGLKGLIKNPTIISPGSYYDEVFDIAYTPALSTLIPYFAYKTESGDLCGMAYNGALATKGFKLTAENRLRHYLKTTQDSISIRYDSRIKKEICSYQSMIKALDIGTVEKHWEIVHLQKDFISYLDSIGVLGKTYFPTWKEVRNTLKENELAIEFIEFPLWNQSKTIYVALTLRKEYEAPHLVPIATNECLDTLSDYNTYSNGLLYRLIWEPLKKELTDIDNVYFSPVGKLHILGIENAIPPISGRNMQQANFIRLSSTRELISIDSDNTNTRKAALYGGLRYSVKKETLEDCPKDSDIIYNKDNERMKQFKGSLEDISEETSIEIDSIANILINNSYVLIVFREQEGTEESFKALSGRQMTIIHVSTHGFYWDENQAEEKLNEKHMDFLQEMSAVYSEEDRALSRSGLLLSGSKSALDGYEVAQDMEDGILTAREIAKLDFDNVDLVSLSACQTGLGDLMSSEGVFGLQRGFKKAGAKSILMTLWEVDDVATRLFMTEFYRLFLSTGNKLLALKGAQQYLRNYQDEEKRKCYNNPKYWAAFILLDAN